MEDGLSLELLDALAAPKLRWPALREVSMVGCMLWSDWQGAEVEAMEARLAALPDLAAKVVKFEGSCQGMEQGRESFFRHLPALRSLELGERFKELRLLLRSLRVVRGLHVAACREGTFSLHSRRDVPRLATPACPSGRGLDGGGNRARLRAAARDAPPHQPHPQRRRGLGTQPGRPAVPHTGATCSHLVPQRSSCS